MLNGKTGIVFGVANKRSDRVGHRAGAGRGRRMRLAFTYQGERPQGKRRGTGRDPARLGAHAVRCRVPDAEIARGLRRRRARTSAGSTSARALGRLRAARRLSKASSWPPNARRRSGWRTTCRAYSLVALARGAAPLDEKSGGGIGDRDDLLRRGKGRRRLQRHGRGQGLAGSLSALPRPADLGAARHPRERDLARGR